MKKVFLTFGDGGDNFKAARERIVREARALGQFNEIIGCDWGDVSPEMRSSPLRNFKRGCGYWIWKPDIIYSALSRLDDGDVLVYCDSGCELRNSKRQWKKLFRSAETRAMVLRTITYCAYQWTKREMLEAFTGADVSQDIHMCFQFEASALVMRKTPFTVSLIDEWRSIAINNPMMFSDAEERLDEMPCFSSSRHDQSVLTLLVYKALSQGYGDKIDIRWDFHFGPNLLGDAAIEIVRNRGGVSKQHNSLRTRIERASQRVVYALQSFFAKRGVMICWTRSGVQKRSAQIT